jgi:purine-binding chemotaxis protein CheW
LRVQEIRGWTPVTRIPELPPHVLGVLNLRGSIVPIIDLRLRFNLAHAEFTPLTVIIVLSIGTSSGPREFGLVVDGVSDVVDIDTFMEAPSLGNGAAVDYIEGLAMVDGRMLIMLNVEELIRRDTEQVPPAALASVA